jgi:hypothetical protein
VAGAGLTISNNSSWRSINLDLPNNTDFRKIQERLNVIEGRLAILQPNQSLQDKFPALQEAYEAYKIIERLILGHEKT